MRIYIPPQLKWPLLIFVIFIGLSSIVRYKLVPKSFGKYGYYRADALQLNAGKQMKFAGHQSCIECHQDIADKKDTDVHDLISCETCHGPGLQHATAEDPATVKLTLHHEREFCGLCHQKNAAKSEDVIFQIDLNEHYTDKQCIDCHNPHAPWDLNEKNLPDENF